MPANAIRLVEEPAAAARHCLTSLPYRMIVFERMNGNTPLFRVAGSNSAALGAKRALKEAHRLHGGNCFYCRKLVKPAALSVDHVEASALDGSDNIQNLVIACKPCNQGKGRRRIEAFHPHAGREWLAALLVQVQDRLNRL